MAYMKLREGVYMRADEGQRYVSAVCAGEKCSVCGWEATHKVGEEILPDDPHPTRSNLTAYVCCEHFQLLFGAAAKSQCLNYEH